MKKRLLLLPFLLGMGLSGWNMQMQAAESTAVSVKFEIPFLTEKEDAKTDAAWTASKELWKIVERSCESADAYEKADSKYPLWWPEAETQTEETLPDMTEEIRLQIEKWLKEELETAESETEMQEVFLPFEETEDETEAEETETDSEQMTETEPAFCAEELEKQFKQLKARFGEQFLFPMTADEAEESLVPELKYTMQLRGYDAVLKWKPKRTIRTLKKKLERQIAEYDGTWSIYCKNLSSNESFVINDIPMKSASVMKLFILGTVYEAFETGELERTGEIMALVENMIVNSDNADSNELLARLGNGEYAAGIARVNAFIESHGFTETTHEYNGFEDPATNMGSGKFNQVTAKDCGKFLEDIYRRTWMGRTVSNEMENLLLSQHTRYKIPAGLPDGVLCGNKSGEMDTTENDAAIIYGPNCDYILVVLSGDWDSKDTAISRIAELSRITYEYLSAE